MAYERDYFDDAELTLLSVEILHDMTDSFEIDPNDPFILALADDIEKEALEEREESSNSNSSTASSSSSYSATSSLSALQLDSESSDNSATRSDSADGPNLALSPLHLSIHHSSTQSHHSVHIVSVECIKPVNRANPKRDKLHKAWNKEESFFTLKDLIIDVDIDSDEIHENISNSHTLSPPLLQFAWQSITSDISSCLSPRDLTPRPKSCEIPVFNETQSEKVKTGKKYKNIKKEHKKHLKRLSTMLIPRGNIRNSAQWK